MILGVVFATLLLFAVTICFHTKRSVTKEHGSWLRSLTEEELCFYYAKQVSVEEKEKQLCQVTDAMIFSDTIPLFVSYFVLCVIVINICLFISGHLSLGATIKADAKLAGDDIIIQDFFQFSIAQSIQQMWDQGLTALTRIIFVCSVLWPYTKQIILLVLWITPPQ